MPTFEQFQEFDIRIGTVRSARLHPTARKPSIQLEIDFGTAGIKWSSAQLNKLYDPSQLPGRQVVAVVNFPPKQIGRFMSEVLVLGFPDGNGAVILAVPDKPVPNGG